MASPVAGLYVDLKAEVAGFKSDLGKAVTAVGQFEQTVNRRLQNVDRSFATLGTGLKAFAGGFVAGALLQGLSQVGTAAVQASQKIQIVDGTLKNLTGSAGGAKEAFDEVFAAAQRVGADVGDFAQGFARFARAGEDLGRSRGEILKFTETIQKLALVGGASTAEAASGALQLSQGLAAGVLQGDELKSILEGMPQVARAIAAEFGVSIGQLKKLGSEGAISADRVFAAIIKAAPQADKEFAALGQTVDQAKARFDNALTKFLSDFDKAIGLSEALKKSLAFGTSAAEAGSRVIDPPLEDLLARRARLEDRIRNPSPELAGVPEDQRKFIPLPAEIGQQVAAAKRELAELNKAIAVKEGEAADAAGGQLREQYEGLVAPLKRVLDLQRDVDKTIAGINEKSREAVKIASIQNETERRVAEARLKARDDTLKSRGMDGAGLDALRKNRPEEAGQIDRLIAAAQRAAESEIRAAQAVAEIVKKTEEIKKIEREMFDRLISAEQENEKAVEKTFKDTSDREAARLKAKYDIYKAVDDEIAQNEKLLAALKIGTEAYEQMKAEIEILNRLKAAGIPITDEEIARARELAATLGKQNAEEQKLTEDEKTRAQVRADITKTVGTAFEDMLLRSGKIGDGFRGLLEDIQRQILRTFVTKPLQNFLDEFLKMAFQINSTTISPQTGGGGGGGGLGILGSLFSIGSSFFGGGFGASGAAMGATMSSSFGGFAGSFADGGAFTVGGRSGVDQNLVAMNLSRGERVDIRPANDTGGRGGGTYYIDARGADPSGLARLERTVRELNGSIEKRAVSAVTDHNRRIGASVGRRG